MFFSFAFFQAPIVEMVRGNGDNGGKYPHNNFNYRKREE